MLKTPVKNKDDDQLYYTKAFLDVNLRKSLKIKLDHESEIFQNLYGASGDVRISYNDATGEYFVKNVVIDTSPSLIHGNGPSKVLLNNFGSYLAGAFKHNECQLCQEDKVDVSSVGHILTFTHYLLKMTGNIYLIGPSKLTKGSYCDSHSESDTIPRRVL